TSRRPPRWGNSPEYSRNIFQAPPRERPTSSVGIHVKFRRSSSVGQKKPNEPPTDHGDGTSCDQVSLISGSTASLVSPSAPVGSESPGISATPNPFPSGPSCCFRPRYVSPKPSARSLPRTRK